MTILSKIANAVGDYRLGIRAGGTAQTSKPGSVYYASIGHRLIREVLDRLKLSENDEFLDIGCGKGRVLAITSSYPAKSIVGIEYEPSLAAVARKNVGHRPNISIVEGAAENFDYSTITAAYAFNPVEPDVLDLILSKIKSDRLKLRDGIASCFRMAYVMESPAQRAVFDSHPWLERYDNFTNRSGHIVSLYCAS